MKPQSVLRLVVMCMLLLPATAWAQSGITGVVRDTSGGILPGVTVEAASPALIAGTSVTVTNEEGRYRFVDLRPGSYSLTFCLTGFQSLRRDGIELQAEFTATVNAELAVGSVEETITVTGEPPVVDVVSVRQQTQITEETLQAIPVNRRMASWAAILPGATVARPSDHDVGGIQGERGAFSIHGGPLVDQSVDGMYQVLLGGRTIYSFNTHAIQEVVVETGAGSAESFSGGSVLHYVYKDGGNQFSGTFSGTQVTGATQSDNLSGAALARPVAAAPAIGRTQGVIRRGRRHRRSDPSQQAVVLRASRDQRHRPVSDRKFLQQDAGLDVLHARREPPCVHQRAVPRRDRPADVAGGREAPFRGVAVDAEELHLLLHAAGARGAHGAGSRRAAYLQPAVHPDGELDLASDRETLVRGRRFRAGGDQSHQAAGGSPD